MERTRPSPRCFSALPALALALILLGLLAMARTFAQSQQLLLAGQDGQLSKTAQSVDNNIMGHFAWYCSDLEYITSRTGFLAAERTYLDGGGEDGLLYHLRENPLPKTVMVESMLALRRGEVALSTSGETDYAPLAVLGRVGAVDIQLWRDGAGRPYVALVQSKPEVGYAALIDGQVFFAIAEEQTAAEDHDRILLLDAQERYFFHRTPQGIRVDAVEGLDPAVHASLYLMLEAQRGGAPCPASSRPGPSPAGSATPPGWPPCPPPATRTAASPWGGARNYDRIIRPYQSAAVQMVLCGVTVMAGAALLLVFLLRSRRSHRQAQRELALLREKAQAMERLNAQTQALAHRQRLESIGTLTSGIAHEFNNLLTPIMGYSILILEKLPPEDTESYDNAPEIYNASQKAKKIVARLSNLSRKGTPGALRPVRLAPLAEQVLAVAAPARPKTVRVETGLASQAPPILGDETQLFQLTLNLVLNSFEALAQRGGTVRVSTAWDGERVSLRVADNGPGIPDEVKAHIFDPFFTTKGSGKGIGLGLAIVQQIVEAHQGTIALDSAAGQGAAFTVSFPPRPAQGRGGPARLSAAPPAPPKPRRDLPAGLCRLLNKY